MKSEEKWEEFKNKYKKNKKSKVMLKQLSINSKYVSVIGGNSSTINEKGIAKNIWPN